MWVHTGQQRCVLRLLVDRGGGREGIPISGAASGPTGELLKHFVLWLPVRPEQMQGLSCHVAPAGTEGVAQAVA